MFLYSQSKIREHEKILYAASKEVMPELGPLRERAFVWRAYQKVTNFSKAV